MTAVVQGRGDTVEALATALSGASCVAVLTGAGVSTESGLPDYRGAAGLWRNRRFEELASIERFREAPVEFWEFYRERLHVLSGAAPNAGHVAIARLEAAGVIEPVITQNVDGLHRQAGSDPVEVHGSLERAVCLSCGQTVAATELPARWAAEADGVPRCGCGDVLKPDVTLFGELLPADAIDRAWDIVERCDAMVVCGSSLAVFPVNHLALQVGARGDTLAIVNVGETALDSLADVRVEAATGEVLPQLAARLLGD